MLGLEELTVKHSGVNLKKVVLMCLAKYYCITSDNGSNILKMVQVVDQEYHQLKFAGIPEVDIEDEFEINELVKCIAGDDLADDEIKGKMNIWVEAKG